MGAWGLRYSPTPNQIPNFWVKSNQSEPAHPIMNYCKEAID